MTTGGPAAWPCPACGWTFASTCGSTTATPSATTSGWRPCAKASDCAGAWSAPFDTVRRYLVTGQIDAGRNRQLAHDLIVTAMTQRRRWGADGVILGDQPEWQAARTAIGELMERYAAGRR